MRSVTPKVTIDARGLEAGLKIAGEWNTRTPAEAVNTAGYAIAVDAQNNMPFVPVPKIDAELSTVVNPVIGKRGKPLKNKKRFTANVEVGKDAPFPALIIQAASNPGSRYNALTNFRYALLRSPFWNKSRAAGRALMADLVHKMIAARHKSPHFLQAGFNVAIQVLRPLSKLRPQRYSGIPGSSQGQNLGSVDPAKPGTSAVCTLANLIGSQGKNAASMDHALQTIGAPILQRAVDREGVNAANYALKKSGQELAELFNAKAGT